MVGVLGYNGGGNLMYGGKYRIDKKMSCYSMKIFGLKIIDEQCLKFNDFIETLLKIEKNL